MFAGPYARSALIYFDRGWSGVLPMPTGKMAKAYPPKGFTGKDSRYPPRDLVVRWVATRRDSNVAIRLPYGVVGIDVDAYEGKDGLATLNEHNRTLGPWLADPDARTVRSSSRSDGISGIYLFRASLPEGRRWRGSIGPGIEIVHAGHRYVMAAPSRHPKTDASYRWLDGTETVRLPEPDDLPELAPAWIEALTKPVHVSEMDTPSGLAKYQAAADGTNYGLEGMRRELDELRAAWDNDTGFNNKLNEAAFAIGQLAGGGELEPAYARGQIEQLMIEVGAPDDQYRTLESGFESGLAQPREAAPQTPGRAIAMASGGLRGDGTMLWYASTEKDDDGNARQVWKLWGDFDVKVLGKIIGPSGAIEEYSLAITRNRDSATIEAVLPVRILAKPLEFTKWLMGYEVAVLGTMAPAPQWNARFQLYLVSQDARESRTAPHLGWDDSSESFLTFDGVLTKDGLQPFDGVRPNPSLRDQAIDYHYGFAGTPEDARGVLREVLTFHAGQVTSVFGAWWAACLLKGQIMRKVSMFPSMGIEATSESGKTNGFFPMMIQLAGNRRGQANDTTANFRDIVAGHRSGIAWQDDLDDPRKLFELIRAATSEGTMGKKGEDRTSSVDAKLVAPIMVSGEGIDMSQQKAMADRVIPLRVGSPKDRKSLHDPSRPQWDDIVALRERWPDMTMLAGHLVALALGHVDLVNQIPVLRGGMSGRHADKLAVVRMGARLLARLTGDDSHIKLVDDWAAAHVDIGNENTLTLLIVPQFLKLVGARSEPRRYDNKPYHSVPFPVLIRPDKDEVMSVWVNTDLLALWWREHHHGKADQRTETADALRGQATDLGMKGQRAGESRRDFLRLRVYEGDAVTANRTEQHVWQRLPDDIAERLLYDFTDDATTEEDTPSAPVVPISGNGNGSGKAKLDPATIARINQATRARSAPR